MPAEQTNTILDAIAAKVVEAREGISSPKSVDFKDFKFAEEIAVLAVKLQGAMLAEYGQHG